VPTCSRRPWEDETPTASAAPRFFFFGLTELDDAKRALRASALRVRAECDPALGADLVAHVLAECPPPAGAIVAGFWPLRGEIDIRPLLTGLHARGNTVVLPVTPPRGAPLIFRVWRPGDRLIAEKFGTVRTDGDVRRPDWLFVPLLAFDRRGGRLGYGGGYYDRTLAGLPGAVAMGCAFAAQEVPHVPMGPHDVTLKAVATEQGIVRPD
jgi:5-formyltetrahydrofolate cyclo-ligase